MRYFHPHRYKRKIVSHSVLGCILNYHQRELKYFKVLINEELNFTLYLFTVLVPRIPEDVYKKCERVKFANNRVNKLQLK